jgi:hypothetical protein
MDNAVKSATGLQETPTPVLSQLTQYHLNGALDVVAGKRIIVRFCRCGAQG